MPIPVDPNEVHEYVLFGDRAQPEEQRTVFLIRPTPYRVARELLNNAGAIDPGTGDANVRVGYVADARLKASLKGWRNFIDPKTAQDVPFETSRQTVCGSTLHDAPTDDTLARIPEDARLELAQAIQNIATLRGSQGNA